MAIVSIPLLGQASGKFSDTEFYRSNGLNILRSGKLKRYRIPSALQLYRQNLLKQLVTLFSTSFLVMKLCYRNPKSYLNFLNYFIKKSYNYFELTELGRLHCISPESLIFSKGDFNISLSCNIIFYSGTELIFEVNSIDFDFTTSSMGYCIMMSYNSVYSTSFAFDKVDGYDNRYVIKYNYPPCHTLDYHCYLCFYDKDLELYSNFVYGFYFSH